MNDNYRGDVEGLRAVAVLPILLFHLNPRLCPGGFAGVDIFFVISGYVITRMIIGQGKDFSLADFYIRRFFRLFPAIIATLAVTMLAAWVILSPRAYVELAESAMAAVLSVSNFYFYWNTGYFQPQALQTPLLHTWSLGVEEQFYLLWPALILGFRRLGVPYGLGFGAAALLSLMLMLVFRHVEPDLTFYMMPFRIFEFAGGALLATHPWIEARASSAHKAVLGAVGALLLAFSLFALDELAAWPSAWTLAPTIATVLLIVAGGGAHWSAILAAPPLRFIGRLSYSLYLVHWPIVTLYRAHIVSDPRVADILLMAGASLACALLLHHAIENPLRFRGKLSVANSPASAAMRQIRLIGVPAGVIAVIAMAVSAIQARGFPSRIDKLKNEEPVFAGGLCASHSGTCAFGDISSKDLVYLIGDSHALNLIAGLDELFRANRIKGIALYDRGCLFLHGTTVFRGRRRKDYRCAQNIEQAYGLLERASYPVIFAGNYRGYRELIGYYRASARLDLTEEEYFRWLQRELVASLRLLGANNRRIVVIGQTYDTGVNIAQCSRQPDSDPNRCRADDRGDARSKARRADDAIRQIGVALPHVKILDPLSVFCASEECTVRDGDALFFIDEFHLSEVGSRFLVRGLSAQLMSAIKRGTLEGGAATSEPNN